MSSKINLKLNISEFRIFKIFIPSLTPLQKEDGPDLGTENFAPFTGHCSPVPYFLNFQKNINDGAYYCIRKSPPGARMEERRILHHANFASRFSRRLHP